MTPYNILFLCTGNSARSIMAEALATCESHGRFTGYSAGSHPSGVINPFAVEMIRTLNYPLHKLRSKSWDEYAQAGAQKMDFVVTVCDDAVGEVCPVWPGQPVTAHWGFPDPAAVQGSDEEKRLAFKSVFTGIQARIRLLMAVPLDKLDRMSMHGELRCIGKNHGVSP
jgi:arsenate reductase (thioredoxin)